MMKDGGMIRGTIAELKANDFVVIVTLTGETKKYPMADVRYAGPASRIPGDGGTAGHAPGTTAASGERPRPLVVVNGGEARLTLTGTQQELTSHLHTGDQSAVVAGPQEVTIQVLPGAQASLPRFRERGSEEMVVTARAAEGAVPGLTLVGAL
jgi:hypothetical protein